MRAANFACIGVFLALAPLAGAIASPPEVTGLRLGSPTGLSWDAQPGVGGYHLYRATLTGPGGGGGGVCLLGSLQANATTDQGAPPAGGIFIYEVGSFDGSGPGPVGFSSQGVEHIPIDPCIPNRRSLDLLPNTGSDGLEETEPPEVAVTYTAETTRGSIDVVLHSGEVIAHADAHPMAVFRSIGGLSTEQEVVEYEEGGVNSKTHKLPGAARFSDIRLKRGFTNSKAFFERVSRLVLDPNGGIWPGTPAEMQRYLRSRYSDAEPMPAPASPTFKLSPPMPVVALTYRSMVQYDGPFGHGWDFDAGSRLRPMGVDLLWHDGQGRRFRFVRTGTASWTAPPEIAARIVRRTDGALELRFGDGSVRRYRPLDGSATQGALDADESLAGSRISYLYDHQGLLTTIVDELGRAHTLHYDGNGRVTRMEDFDGRETVYSYDALGNLTSVRSPIVTGTPNGNDFPAGKTTLYEYSTGLGDPRLNHNLLSITSPGAGPGGTPFVQLVYDENPASPGADRVTTETLGVPLSGVGGVLAFTYEQLNPGADPADRMIPRRRTILTDRSLNLHEAVHNAAGQPLSLIDRTNRDLRPGEPDYLTLYAYDGLGRVVQLTSPEGNDFDFTWDTSSEPYRRRNLLEWRTVADSQASGGRGDGHGSELPDRVWSWTYEPIGNQLATSTDPRGNVTTWTYDYQEGDPATNGISDLAARYGISLAGTPFNLGDVNGDGRIDQKNGWPIRWFAPEVLLDPGSHQAAIEGDTTQQPVALMRYNDFAQLIEIVDPEMNHHQIAYNPEIDPDGDGSATPPPPDGRTLATSEGGSPHRFVWDYASDLGRNNDTDPVPVLAQTDYEYDARGNVTRVIDPRGVATDYVYNQLDQVVEMRAASATATTTGRGEAGLPPLGFVTRYEWDLDDNMVHEQREDVGETRGVGPYLDVTYEYDLLGNRVAMRRETTTGLDAEWLYEYDASQNLTAVTSPEGRRHTLAWDERDLPLSSTNGASGPAGGSPSTRNYEYDGNGNLVRLVDGRGGVVDYQYDGFDRLVRQVDQSGNTAESFYDSGGNVARRLDRGPVGGPEPPDRSGSTNVDLQDTRYSYDALDRLVRTDSLLFVPSGASPVRPPVIDEGPLVPGDGAVNRVFEYDRLSRRTFVVEDTEATTRYDYDGLSRLVRTTHPDGSDRETAWDPAGNLIEEVATDLSSVSGPSPERFFTTMFHDALGRPVATVDNLGQTRRLAYDSLDAVVLVTDAKGPVSGSIQRRSPAGSGMSIAVNAHGNVTRFGRNTYGQAVDVTRILSPGGQGNGTLTPPVDTTNPANPDGQIAMHFEYDRDGHQTSAQDDNGNETLYEYDNLDRLARVQADDGTARILVHDQEGNLVESVEPAVYTIVRGYDRSHRLQHGRVGSGFTTEGTTEQTYEYDGLGRLTRATDNNDPFDSTDDATTIFIHDSLGRRLEETSSLSDGSSPGTASMQWRGANLPTLLIYPSGRQIAYQYDPFDRLILVDDVTSPGTAEYQYYGMSRVHTRLYANGVRSTVMNNAGTADIGLDGALRATLIRHLTPTNALLAGFESRYDRNGNRTSLRRGHHVDAALNAMGEIYTYDSADRLMTFQEGFLNALHQPAFTPTDTQSWSLDGAGNWATFARLGQPYRDTPNNNNEYDEPQSGGTRFDDGVPDDFGDDLLTSVPDGMNLEHDRNGNRIEGGALLYYDAFNRLVRATQPATGMPIAFYRYDGLGRRVKRVVGASPGPTFTVRSWYWGSGDIEERDATGAVTRQTVRGLGDGGGIWQIRGSGSIEYLLEDALGSTVAMTSGTVPQVLERVTYDAYGKPTMESAANVRITDPLGAPVPMSTVGNPRLFAGMHYDPELGMRSPSVLTDRGGMYQASHGRYYDSNQGRHLTRDPGGVWADPANGGNGYAYAAGNPVSSVEACFNPKEYTITKSTPWKHHEIQGLDAPTVEFDAFDGAYYVSRATHIYQHNQSDLDFMTRLTLEHKYVYQHNQTNLEFIRTRANRSGFEVTWDDHLHYFKARRSAAGVVQRVHVRGWDPEKKQEIVGKAPSAFNGGTIPSINSLPSISLFNWSVQNIPLIGSISVGLTIVPPAAPSGPGDVVVKYFSQRSNPFPFTKN